MKRWTFAVLSAFLLAFCLSLTPRVASAGVAEDQAAIKDLWVTYAKLVVAGDANTWLKLWDAGGIQMPPGAPARPKSVLDEAVPAAWAPGIVSAMTITPEEINILGDYAYSRGVYTLAAKDGNVDGKFMTILKRQSDGTWKIYRDIFNSNK